MSGKAAMQTNTAYLEQFGLIRNIVNAAEPSLEYNRMQRFLQKKARLNKLKSSFKEKEQELSYQKERLQRRVDCLESENTKDAINYITTLFKEITSAYQTNIDLYKSILFVLEKTNEIVLKAKNLPEYYLGAFADTKKTALVFQEEFENLLIHCRQKVNKIEEEVKIKVDSFGRIQDKALLAYLESYKKICETVEEIFSETQDYLDSKPQIPIFYTTRLNYWRHKFVAKSRENDIELERYINTINLDSYEKNEGLAKEQSRLQLAIDVYNRDKKKIDEVNTEKKGIEEIIQKVKLDLNNISSEIIILEQGLGWDEQQVKHSAELAFTIMESVTL
ncbi:MAG: hypothetical protein K0R12_691 [Gammaproteobacteria bacterium]|jgi:hypothetical protein|nr:hypothetical protein [Gammaproteobacteria bacterium]